MLQLHVIELPRLKDIDPHKRQDEGFCFTRVDFSQRAGNDEEASEKRLNLVISDEAVSGLVDLWIYIAEDSLYRAG